jgi:hypothetical protein
MKEQKQGYPDVGCFFLVTHLAVTGVKMIVPSGRYLLLLAVAVPN